MDAINMHKKMAMGKKTGMPKPSIKPFKKGGVHEDEALDRALIKKMVKKDDLIEKKKGSAAMKNGGKC